MTVYVALVRGINVGKSTSVSMEQLVRAVERAGGTEISTILRSGNVVFTAGEEPSGAELESALERESGVRARVLVLSGEAFSAVAQSNPLAQDASDGSRLFVTFLSEPIRDYKTPDAAELAPERLTVGKGAVYQWFPDGSQKTKVSKAFWAQFAGFLTSRNANTVEKILARIRETAEKT